MSSPTFLEHQSYDHLVGHASPFSLRLNDATHQNIKVGDIVQFKGHSSIMDRQKFKVVARMDHPTVEGALNSIEHSSLSVRDKISMAESFRGVHGAAANQHGAVALHLEPHSGPSGYNHSVSTLG